MSYIVFFASVVRLVSIMLAVMCLYILVTNGFMIYELFKIRKKFKKLEERLNNDAF